MSTSTIVQKSTTVSSSGSRGARAPMTLAEIGEFVRACREAGLPDTFTPMVGTGRPSRDAVQNLYANYTHPIHIPEEES